MLSSYPIYISSGGNAYRLLRDDHSRHDYGRRYSTCTFHCRLVSVCSTASNENVLVRRLSHDRFPICRGNARLESESYGYIFSTCNDPPLVVLVLCHARPRLVHEVAVSESKCDFLAVSVSLTKNEIHCCRCRNSARCRRDSAVCRISNPPLSAWQPV